MATQNILVFDAPAKLNLRLKICGRRQADGYHLLSMLNAPTSLADRITLEFTSSPEVQLQCEGDGVDIGPLPENSSKNLIVRAFELVRRHLKFNEGARIHLVKRIPIGAGLGGGSSDAGALLRQWLPGESVSLPSHHGRLSIEDATKFALSLGADVPYFLSPKLSIVEGVGERVTPLEPPDHAAPLHALLLVPKVFVETQLVYKLFRAAHPEIKEHTGRELRESAQTIKAMSPKDFQDWLYSLIENDLADTVSRNFAPMELALKAAHSVATKNGMKACLTGSGAGIFVVRPDFAQCSAAQGEAFALCAKEANASLWQISLPILGDC